MVAKQQMSYYDTYNCNYYMHTTGLKFPPITKHNSCCHTAILHKKSMSLAFPLSLYYMYVLLCLRHLNFSTNVKIGVNLN